MRTIAAASSVSVSAGARTGWCYTFQNLKMKEEMLENCLLKQNLLDFASYPTHRVPVNDGYLERCVTFQAPLYTKRKFWALDCHKKLGIQVCIILPSQVHT